MSIFPTGDVASLWQATRNASPEFDHQLPSQRQDVVIIGGGYTGLSSALYLAERGQTVVVIDANRVGWGASGRNGGVVFGKFRVSFKDIASRYGGDHARGMYRFGKESVDHLKHLVERFSIDADFRENGLVYCAHSAKAMRGLQADRDWLADNLGETANTVLSAQETCLETGSPGFAGGIHFPKGGTIQPLNYVLGLARGVHRLGVSICEGTAALRIGRDRNGMIVETSQGPISAAQLLIATDGYSALTPATWSVKNGIIPFRSAMIATEKLPSELFASLMRGESSYHETRRMMRWFRKYDGRVIYGGRGAFGKQDSDSAFEGLRAAMIKQFPSLSDVHIDYQWSGLVSLTLDAMPHIGRVDDRLSYAVGYNGSGVAIASYAGRYAADVVLGRDTDASLITLNPLRQVPLYAVREPAVRLIAGWYQFLDKAGF